MNRLTRRILPIAGALALAACVHDAEEDSGKAQNVQNGTSAKGITVDFRDTSEVTSITGATITTSHTECEEGILHIEERVKHYEITGDTLIAWEDGDCAKRIYTGTSETIQGSWTATFETLPTGIPDCDPEDFPTSEFIEDAMGTVIISEKMVETHISGSVCIAEFIAAQAGTDGFFFDDEETSPEDSAYAEVFGSPRPSNISVVDCSEVKFTMFEGGLDMPATIKFEQTPDGGISMNMEAGGCQVMQSSNLWADDTRETCDEETQMDSTGGICFLGYILENGCMTDMMLASGEPPPPGMEKVDCNTMQLTLTPEMVVRYTWRNSPEGPVLEITMGPCSTSVPFSLEGDFPDELSAEFEQCLEANFSQPGAKVAAAGRSFRPVIPTIRWPLLKP